MQAEVNTVGIVWFVVATGISALFITDKVCKVIVWARRMIREWREWKGLVDLKLEGVKSMDQVTFAHFAKEVERLKSRFADAELRITGIEHEHRLLLARKAWTAKNAKL